MIFVFGGVRSGKSRFALEEVKKMGNIQVLFVATADAGDDEMRRRIMKHKQERPTEWYTLEAATLVGDAIKTFPEQVNAVIIDCITVLLGNVLSEFEELFQDEEIGKRVNEEVQGILSAYKQGESSYIIVSNEVGMGVVPAFPLGRVYRDWLGITNQKLAAAADEVYFMLAGIPMKIK